MNVVNDNEHKENDVVDGEVQQQQQQRRRRRRQRHDYDKGPRHLRSYNSSNNNKKGSGTSETILRMMKTKKMKKSNVTSIEEQEELARSMQIRNPLILAVLGFYAACKVMLFYLVNIETLVACGASAGLTVYWYNYGVSQLETLGNEWNGGGMDYVILAFAVTSPIAAAIGMAFNRRERALIEIADFQSFAHQLYMSHSLWDWDHDEDDDAGDEYDFDDDNGTVVTTKTTTKSTKGNDATTYKFHIDRSRLRLKHSDAVLTQLIGIGDEMARFLTLPTVSRSIHRMTKPGKQQAAETVDVAYRLMHSMTSHRLTRLSVYGERIKKAGLSAGELSRIRQYERFLEDNVKRLRMIKVYRTPQAFRSFARLFTVFLPPFYAPTYAQVAIDTHSLGLGVAFGIVTALALTALFESLQVLEDPFVAILKLDGIDCREEFQVLLWTSLVNTRRSIFPNAPPFPERRRKALEFNEVHSWSDNGIEDVTTGATLHSPKPSRLPSLASLNTTNGLEGTHHPHHHHGSYTRIFDVEGARHPRSLHGYNAREKLQQVDNPSELDAGKEQSRATIDGIDESSIAGNTVIVTRSDSLEFGDPWDDLDLDLDLFTIDGDGNDGIGVGIGDTTNNSAGAIDLQVSEVGDVLEGAETKSVSPSVSSVKISSHHTTTGPPGSIGGTQHHPVHRRIKSSVPTIGVRESDFERDRRPTPSSDSIINSNHHHPHHNRARTRTATSIPNAVFDGSRSSLSAKL